MEGNRLKAYILIGRFRSGIKIEMLSQEFSLTYYIVLHLFCLHEELHLTTCACADLPSCEVSICCLALICYSTDHFYFETFD